MTKLSSKFSRMRPKAPIKGKTTNALALVEYAMKLELYSIELEKYADTLENEIIEMEKSE